MVNCNPMNTNTQSVSLMRLLIQQYNTIYIKQNGIKLIKAIEDVKILARLMSSDEQCSEQFNSTGTFTVRYIYSTSTYYTREIPRTSKNFKKNL